MQNIQTSEPNYTMPQNISNSEASMGTYLAIDNYGGKMACIATPPTFTADRTKNFGLIS